eukprot:TRINITY_DN4312_c1_g1_i1.p1 TRINITY_DN4312_c1_g1~~TRINITY_DN4312_c1_g1_i1.p1  ORF type:complete len:403 (+),score=83.41 TRINITY_DN4312_c1_g1_i1:1-1209(+)
MVSHPPSSMGTPMHPVSVPPTPSYPPPTGVQEGGTNSGPLPYPHSGGIPPNPVLMQQPPMVMANGYQQAVGMGSIGFVQPPVPMPPQGYHQMVRYDSGKEGTVPSPMGHVYSGQLVTPQQSLQTQSSLAIAPSQQSTVSQDQPGVQYSEQRYGGTVKWFNAAKGYGFIRPDNGDEDLFVHQTDIISQGYRNLIQGSRVEYGIEPIADGRSKAVQVSGPGGQELEDGGQPQKPRQGENNNNNNANGGYMYMYPPYPYGGRGAYPRDGYYPSYPPPYGYYPYNHIGGGKDDKKGDKAASVEHPMPYRNFAPDQNPNGQMEQSRSSGNQIVIHNLAWSCTWQELKDAFTEWNPIRADVAQDAVGRSRGFGVVRFANKEDAQAAIENMNNGLVAGRPVTVRLDKYA